MYYGKAEALFYAKCPYYKSEFTKSLTCEGYDNSIVMTKFESEDHKDQFIKEHCLSYPNECPLALGLDMLFEE